mmetsp:Transcript_66296/g.176884  ORF Transcript_66296/g.176884 Transcript_66296/m.176884 type:complete len:111 (+) Transcript_66296:592-924(+)
MYCCDGGTISNEIMLGHGCTGGVAAKHVFTPEVIAGILKAECGTVAAGIPGLTPPNTVNHMRLTIPYLDENLPSCLRASSDNTVFEGPSGSRAMTASVAGVALVWVVRLV